MLWYRSKIGERLKRNQKCFHGFEIRYWTWHRPSEAWQVVRGISYNPQIMFRQLNFSRLVSVEERNASEGRCHDRFNIESQIMETYPIPFSSLSDVTMYEYDNLRATKLLSYPCIKAPEGSIVTVDLTSSWVWIEQWTARLTDCALAGCLARGDDDGHDQPVRYSPVFFSDHTAVEGGYSTILPLGVLCYQYQCDSLLLVRVPAGFSRKPHSSRRRLLVPHQ